MKLELQELKVENEIVTEPSIKLDQKIDANIIKLVEGKVGPLGIEFIKIPAVSFNMGSNDGDSDEKPVHQVQVSGFLMSKTEVTVGQYRKCVEAGRCTEPSTSSSYCNWNKSGREDHPINCVDWGQARTFAKWVGANVDLPTEAEWECAARSLPTEGNFLETKIFHPVHPSVLARLDVFPEQVCDAPLQQLFGDVWEWTSSAYSAYPGFRPEALAVGEYSGKFMSGQMVLRGGSCATPRSHIRATYRNFLPPHARWQFSGFRLAR